MIFYFYVLYIPLHIFIFSSLNIKLINMAHSLRQKKSSKKVKRNVNKRGGAVRMPLEYYGGSSGRYFASGDAKLADGSSAYGPFYSVSQGVPSPDGQTLVLTQVHHAHKLVVARNPKNPKNPRNPKN